MNRTALALLGTVTLLAGCSSPPAPDTAGRSVDNCGHSYTFDAAPESVVLLHSAAVPTLHALGVLDRVSAKAGVFPGEYFPADLAVEVAAIPSISEKTDATGHLQLSREEVVAQHPDLVLGTSTTVNAATMRSAGVPVIEEPAFCGGLEGPVSFEDAWEQVRLYGRIFDRDAEAAAHVTALKEQLPATPARELRGMALYPTADGAVTYAYGSGSMVTPVLEAAGVDNLFADNPERVFEVSAEEIIARDPDFILVLHTREAEAEPARQLVGAIPGIDTTGSARADRIMPLLLNFAEPPTPLAVSGVAKIDDFLAGHP